MYRCFLVLMLACIAGCLQPIRTDSRVTIDQTTPVPITAKVAVQLGAKVDAEALQEMPVGGPANAAAKIAIIDADGLLLNQNLAGPYANGDNPVDSFREKLDAAAHDPHVAAVVVRINSPGGAVTAVDIMWRELQTFRANSKKPVVACLLDHGTSGGYYLATASDQIVAHPTTVTGGIGVTLNLFNLQDAMAVFSIVNQSIRSGKYTDMGNVTAPLPQDTKKMLQTMADEFHDRFQAVVKQQRQQINANDPELFDGRVFTAKQALDRKLIDRIGYLDDAVAVARQLANQSEARVVLYHRPSDPARTPYATTANVPIQTSLIPVSLPGIDRTRLPTFLYLWQPDPTLLRLSGQ